MGWNWRKRFNFGPFRINLSRRGIGYSVGVPGFRVGQDAKGQNYTQTSVPGTGIYKRDYSGTQSRTRNWNWAWLLVVLLVLLLAKWLLK